MASTAQASPGITTRLLVDHVQRSLGEDAVLEVLRSAKVDRAVSELRDDGSWFTRAEVLALFDAAAEVLRDPSVGRNVGASLLGADARLREVLVTLGDPANLLQRFIDSAAVLHPTADLRVAELADTSAVVTYRMHDGFDAHIHDCGYVAGLLSQAPVAFGLPPASVAHPRCQVLGDDHCRYELAWLPLVRLRRLGLLPRRSQARGLAGRFLALEADAPDLAVEDGAGRVIDELAGRAAEAVGAIGYVVVLPEAGGADELLDRAVTGLVDDGDPRHLVAEIASGGRRHGHLVLLFDDRHEHVPEEATILRAHARRAAVAIDVASVVDAARLREATASGLLDLARSLAELNTMGEVCERLAERTIAIAACDQAGAWLWDADARAFRAAGTSGLDADVARELATFTVGDDWSGLPQPITDEPLIVSSAACRGFVGHVADRLHSSWLAFVPVRIRGRLRAVIACSWRDDAQRPALDVLRPRLAGIADQAATAIENASLLEQVHHQALHDALTGLPNQTLFADRVSTALDRARRDRSRVAVAVLDLDRFKTVNDSLGHRAGDELLVQVAGRLNGAVRAPDTIARMGGDEFTILLVDVAEGGEAVVAQRILEAFVRPFEVDGHRLRVSPSIGIATHPSDGDGFEELLRCADVAMYRAKERGRNTWATYAHGMSERAYDRLTLESDLYRALQRRELRVDYQPIARLDGTFVGMEALVRWAHPALGLLAPEEFLPIAEEVGLMAEIDGWVLRQACLELGAAGDDTAYLAVNLSDRTLSHPALDRMVGDALAAGGLDPARLVIEICESVTAGPTSTITDAMRSLRTRGVRVALDDFGRGMSALSQLESLPIDQLKIDASFVAPIESPGAPAPVVAAIVAMGQGLGLEVVAEGIETEAQRGLARRLGIDLVQGWLVGRPSALGYEGARSRTA